MISDTNISQAIDSVNKAHRWYGRHKPNKRVIWIEKTKNERIKELRQIILNGFVPTKAKIRVTYDKNSKKYRNICEPRLYPDQYVHHILVQALEPVFMRGMDPYCCGSVKGRGIRYGKCAIEKWMRSDYSGTRYCLEMDIRHFYDNLQPCVVMQRLRHLIKDRKVLDLCERVMKYGIMIGAYFSQWFANVTLQELDVIIRQSGAKHYIRYLDNFTVFCNRKRTLHRIRAAADKWLRERHMKLKYNYQVFKTICRMPDALGFRYSRKATYMRKHSLYTMTRQIRRIKKMLACGVEVPYTEASGVLSRIGRLRMCNSYVIYKRYVGVGFQRKMKDIVRKYQKERLTVWSIFLACQTNSK